MALNFRFFESDLIAIFHFFVKLLCNQVNESALTPAPPKNPIIIITFCRIADLAKKENVGLKSTAELAAAENVGTTVPRSIFQQIAKVGK